jgi:hypothetical protein
MLSADSNFTRLERAVLEAILRMHPHDRAALEAQFVNARVVNRENTGAGFYTHFTIARDGSAAINGERIRRGPSATIEGLQHGMGFILWLADGFADCLEGYSYGESTIYMSLENASFDISTTALDR